MKIAAAFICAVCGLWALAATAASPIPNPPTRLCVEGGRCSSANDPRPVRARSAADFIESIGVNVHFTVPSTPYVTSFPLAKEKLLELGVRHIRDGAVSRDGTFFARDGADLFRELGAAGVRGTFIFDANVTKEFVQGFPARVAPAFEAYEFPNELNGTADPAWSATLKAWGPAFRSYVESERGTARYPIIGPSLIDKGDNPFGTLGDLADTMTFGNVHAYYSSRNPGTVGWGRRAAAPCDAFRYGSTGYNLCNTRRVSRAKPIISTETGWGTDVTLRDHVPEPVQAKYLARMLLLHFNAGVRRTFIYQFMDAGRNSFNAYGLITESGKEKASFAELKNLIALMRDSADGSTTTGGLPMALLGNAGADLRTTVLRKSDGSFRVVLWLEKPSFDPVGRVPLVVAPSRVTVRFSDDARVRRISTFQDDGSVRVTAPPRESADGYALTVTDNLTVVEVTN